MTRFLQNPIRSLAIETFPRRNHGLMEPLDPGFGGVWDAKIGSWVERLIRG